jgi:hypothetical protein
MNLKQARAAISAVPGWKLEGLEVANYDEGDQFSVRVTYYPLERSSAEAEADRYRTATSYPEVSIHLDGAPLESVVNRVVAHARALTDG